MPNQLISLPNMRPRFIAGAVGTALVALLLVQTINPAVAKTGPAHTLIPPASAAGQPASFADVVEAVRPAVVTISTAGRAPIRGRGLDEDPRFQLPPDSPFREFFDRFFDGPHGQPQRGEKVAAVGSGFIIDPQGFVVTNHHVIKGAEEITVVTNDGKRHPAEPKGYDSKTDLALLKIESETPMPYVVFGDSDKARVGDWVIAIGNPFGLGGTATTGIISARGRDIRSGPLDDFLQIDAPINRGNSGGPLFTADGKVVGVNTAIFSPNGGNVGIGFAIPSTMAKSVIAQLMKTGHVDRGWLGVQIQAVTDDIAESLDLEENHGALVASVVGDSPAEVAGIQAGDVILKFDGKDVKSVRELPKLVANVAAERKVDIEVWRNNQIQNLSVTIGRNPEDAKVADSGFDSANDRPELGLTLVPLTPENRREYGVAGATNGVLVTNVRLGSPAARKGLSPGDVIKMVGDKKVESPQDVVAAVKRAADDKKYSVLMLVERRGNDRFVAVKFA